MKRILTLILTLCLLVLFSFGGLAAGNVIYEKDSGKFIFEYGSEHSVTDLFSDFKSVMPGDDITQTVTVKNNASNKVKVKIYMRSLGAETGSEDFLSELSLRVKKSDQNTMDYMFDAAANETAGLTDWVLLGTLYSGGEVNLEVNLKVPTSLGNDFAARIGQLNWQFMVEEFPIDPSDPKPPQTGDGLNLIPWIALLAASLIFVIFFIILLKRQKRRN